MQPTVKVKSEDAAVRSQREAAAQRVLDAFGNELPQTSLLCFLMTRTGKPSRTNKGRPFGVSIRISEGVSLGMRSRRSI